MRRRIELGVLLCLGLLTTGCDKKATGQTVAVVNGEEITMGELNSALGSVNVPATADKEAIRAQVLQAIVNRRLLSQQAREQGVDKSPDFVTRQRQMTEQLLIGLNAERQGNTAALPSQRVIDEFISSHPGAFQGRELWSLRQIQFETPTAPAALDRMKQARTLDQLTAALTALRIPFQRGETTVDTAALPQELLGQINKLPANEPFIVPQAGRMIASVIVSRRPNPTPADQSRQLAVQAIRKQETETRLQNSLKQLRSSAKIEYQQGFAPKASATGT